MAVSGSVLLWNCNGYQAHRQQLLLYLDALKASRSPFPSLILLTELKVAVNFTPSLPGYTCFARPFSSDSSGCAIFVKKSIPAQKLSLSLSSPHVLGVECWLPGVSHPLRVLCVYRRDADGRAGWNSLEADLRTACEDGAPILVGGDFNAHHPHWSRQGLDRPCQYGSRLFDLCTSLRLTVLNHTLAHRISTHIRGNILDLFLTNCPHLFSSLSIDADSALDSDHFPLLLTLPPVYLPPVHVRPRWYTQRANSIGFQVACNIVSPPFIRAAEKTLSSDSPPQRIADEVYGFICQSLILGAAVSIPHSYRPARGKPWWYAYKEQLQAAYRELKRARRAHHRAKTATSREKAARRLEQARKDWKRTVADAQAAYRLRCTESLVTPDGTINWREWRKQTRSSYSPPFSVQGLDGSLPSSPREALNNVAAYLSSVFSPVQRQNLPQDVVDHHNEVANTVAALRTAPLPVSPTDSREKDFTLKELQRELHRLDTKKAYGPDDIHPFFLSRAPHSLVLLILKALNFFWARGVLPSLWKKAYVTVIYKGDGPRELASSYRPISLTCILCKVFERLVLTRISSSIPLSPSQAGFRPARSCGDQIYLLAEAARDALQREREEKDRRVNYHRSVAFIDFSKAFDRVDHTSFLYKLHKKGVGPRVWRFFDAFLSGRSFQVISGGYRSDLFPISAGVPQGSISGPLAFCVLIDDLPEEMERVHCTCQLFADDVAARGRNLGSAGDDQLQKGLDVLYRWTLKWKLVINLDKSVFIVFSSRRYTPNLFVGGRPLTAVEYVRYLGVWFTKTLSWHHHAQRVLAKAKAASHLLCRIAAGVRSVRVVRALVLAIVRARIIYGFPFWRPSPTDLTNLQRCMLKPLRKALGLPDSAQSESVLAELGIPTLQRTWQHYLLSWAAKSIDCGYRSDYLKGQLPAVSKFHSCLSRCFGGEPDQDALPYQALTLWQSEWQPLVRPEKRLIRPDESPELSRKRSTALQCIRPRQLKRIALLLSYRDWRTSRQGALQSWRRDDEPGLALYLQHDERATFVLRARLRFARSYLRHHQHRLGLSADAVCQECDTGRNETIDHVVLECPKYSEARRQLQEALALLGVRLSPSLVLGQLTTRELRVAKRVLEATGTFLRTVHELRSL